MEDVQNVDNAVRTNHTNGFRYLTSYDDNYFSDMPTNRLINIRVS